MKSKWILVLVLCLIGVAVPGIAASPAVAASGGLPHLGTPDVARVLLYDGEWWTGRYDSGGPTWAPAQPGTPIPLGDYVTICAVPFDAVKSLIEQTPQVLLYSVTVKNARNEVVLKTTEEQSAQFYGPVTWDPAERYYYRLWEVPLGQLPAGTYDVTLVDRLTETLVTGFEDENGDWIPIVVKPFRWVFRTSFNVQ